MRTAPQLHEPQPIVVASYAEAIVLAPRFPSVVSLVASTHPNLQNHPNRCCRPFDDTVNGLDGTPASQADVRAVLAFSTTAPLPMLVHCALGQSRAPATALGILVDRGYQPSFAAEMLIADHPANRPFTPNVWVLSVFDDVLGLNGALLRDAARWRLT